MPKNVAEDEGELIDLVNEHNQVIGSVQRKECHGNPSLHHRAVHIFVINPQGEYCLQKRSQAKRIQPGKWDTSVGGHIPAGESYEQGALRELEEELGVRLESATFLQYSHEYIWRSSVETEHVRTYLLPYDGSMHFNAVEIDDIRFWSVLEIRATVGSGVFTPNLEQEFRNLKVI